jgi:hypothetical protein
MNILYFCRNMGLNMMKGIYGFDILPFQGADITITLHTRDVAPGYIIIRLSALKHYSRSNETLYYIDRQETKLKNCPVRAE